MHDQQKASGSVPDSKPQAPSLEKSKERLHSILSQLKTVISPCRQHDAIIHETEQFEQDFVRICGERDKALEALSTFSNPFEHGVVLSPPKNNRVTIGIQGIRYNVGIDLPPEKMTAARPGTEVLVYREGRAVADVVGKYTLGQSAEVLNTLNPLHPPIRDKDNNNETKNNDKNCSYFPGDCKHFTHLHVRYGNNEEMVAETSEELLKETLNIGDIVRVDMRLGFAFDKLPSFEAGPLLLESDPNVDYYEIGGLYGEIEQIREAIEYPYLYRDLFKSFRLKRPKGILLYGPPGCGKTLIAKAIATGLGNAVARHFRGLLTAMDIYDAVKDEKVTPEYIELWQQIATADNKTDRKIYSDLSIDDIADFLGRFKISPQDIPELRPKYKKFVEDGVKSYFMNVKGPELLDKYVGETEHKLRKIFDEAKRVASQNTPVVIFFDEMEAMFQSRGSGISSDMEKTIVPQLLAEMDGVEGMENVVVIGASNRADLIDQAILRPGRLDIKIKIDRPDRHAAKAILDLNLLPEKQELAKRKNENPNLKNGETANPGFSASGLEFSNEGLFDKQGAPIITSDHPTVANALNEMTLDILYSNKNVLRVKAKDNSVRVFPLSQFVSGALLAGIVSRAKREALKRLVKPGKESITNDRCGISIGDMRNAILCEYQENAEQMIRNVSEYAKKEFKAEVLIGQTKTSRWDEPHPAPYLAGR